MSIFAANLTEKFQHIPRGHLANLGLGILILLVAIFLIKQAAKMNRFVLFMIILVTVFVVGFTWVYERNEPKFLKPVIDQIAPFFPQRVKY